MQYYITRAYFIGIFFYSVIYNKYDIICFNMIAYFKEHRRKHHIQQNKMPVTGGDNATRSLPNRYLTHMSKYKTHK